jgi:hypothetical protein
MIRVRPRASIAVSRSAHPRVDGAVQDDVLAERVVLGAAVGVAHDQRERVDHWLVGGVVGAELEHAKQPDQPAAVVIGVGRLEHLALLALILGPLRSVLGHEILQRRLAADDRVNHLTDRVVRGAQGRLGDLAQQRLLARHALVVLDELRDDLLLRVGVDPVHRGDQQLREAVDDLPLA